MSSQFASNSAARGGDDDGGRRRRIGQGVRPLARVKSSNRKRSVTVRPTRPALRIRPVTRSTSRRSTTSRSSRERRRRPSACCDPIDPRRRPPSTRRGSRLWASACEMATGVAADDRRERPLVHRRHLPDRVHAPVVQLRGGDDADTPQPFDRQRVQEPSSPSGSTTSRPSGLPTPLATFARNFVRATPTVIGRPTSLGDPLTEPLGDHTRACRPAATGRRRRGTPRRSTSVRRSGWCRRRSRTPPCSPRRTHRSAAGRRSGSGTAGGPRRPASPCAPRSASPRSSPRAPRHRRP